MTADDRGQTTPEAEAAALADTAAPVSFRVLLERHDDGTTTALRIELTTGSLQEDDSREWDYGGLFFARGWTNGRVTADWLSERRGEIATMRGPVPFEISFLPETGQWERLPSGAGHDRPPLRWPYRRAAFSSGQMLAPSKRPSFLVGPMAPSFPSYEHAAELFFHGELLTGVPARASDVLVIRWQREEARIDRVVFSAGAVEVGLALTPAYACDSRTSLQIDFGPGEGLEPGRVRIDDRNKSPAVTFDLPAGVPEEWWVVLSEDNRWVDYRHHSRHRSWPSDAELVAGALSPDDEVRMMLIGGEGSTMEFKRQMPTDNEGKRKLARTIAAFANGQGGIVLFGIDPDEVTVVGISETFSVARDRLTNIGSDHVTPRPGVGVYPYETCDGLVVAVVVEPGQAPPYGVGRENPRYYVRRNATTMPARQDEVRLLARGGISPQRWF